jgi:hypothetical protein
MRVLLIFCHPLEDSYNAALHRAAKAALGRAGHAVDDCDLYAEGFDPVLSRQERIDHHDPAINRAAVAGYGERLLAAEALGALLSGLELRSAGPAQGLPRSRFSAGRELRSERRRADRAAPAAHPQDRGDRHLRAPAPGRLVHGRPAPPVLHARPAPSDPPRRPRRVSCPLPHECLDRGDAHAFSPRWSAPWRGSESRCTRPAGAASWQRCAARPTRTRLCYGRCPSATPP